MNQPPLSPEQATTLIDNPNDTDDFECYEYRDGASEEGRRYFSVKKKNTDDEWHMIVYHDNDNNLRLEIYDSSDNEWISTVSGEEWAKNGRVING